jgi:hypothetical protein
MMHGLANFKFRVIICFENAEDDNVNEVLAEIPEKKRPK